MPDLSIITISYNQNDFLPMCVESIAAQAADFDIEHIVVDAGSTDGSREYLKSLAFPHLRLVFMPDSGPAQGLNHGLQASLGDYVLYINADDEIAPGAIETVVGAHRETPGADILVNDGWLIDDRSNPVRHFTSSRLTPARAALNIAVILQQSTSFKGNVIREAKFDEKNRLDWDGELAWRVIREGGNICYKHGTVGYFRIHKDSITSNSSLQMALNRSHRARARTYSGYLWPLRLLSYFSRAAWLLYSRTRGHFASFPGLSRVPAQSHY